MGAHVAERGRAAQNPRISLFLILFIWLPFLGGFLGCVPLTYKSVAKPQSPVPQQQDYQQQQILLQSTQSSLNNYQDYKIGPEDVLVVEVYGQEALKREVRVNGKGQISMPLVGVVKVSGMSTREAEARLRELYGSEFLKNPQISLEVKEFHHQRVAVTGAVDKPGFFEIIGPRTLLEVLSLAGGFSSKPKAEAGDVIHVIRQGSAADVAQTIKRTGYLRSFDPQTKTTVIDMKRLFSGEFPALNLMVENGDVVHVPFAGNAYVLGGVRKPGNVTVRENLTLSQAVALAGGVDPLLGTNKITIMRFDKEGRPQRIEADLKKIQDGRDSDILVHDNDAVVVFEGEAKKKLWVLRQLIPIPSGGYAIPTQ